jgi:hypothetical protein
MGRKTIREWPSSQCADLLEGANPFFQQILIRGGFIGSQNCEMTLEGWTADVPPPCQNAECKMKNAERFERGGGRGKGKSNLRRGLGAEKRPKAERNPHLTQPSTGYYRLLQPKTLKKTQLRLNTNLTAHQQ